MHTKRTNKIPGVKRTLCVLLTLAMALTLLPVAVDPVMAAVDSEQSAGVLENGAAPTPYDYEIDLSDINPEGDASKGYTVLTDGTHPYIYLKQLGSSYCLTGTTSAYYVLAAGASASGETPMSITFEDAHINYNAATLGLWIRNDTDITLLGDNTVTGYLDAQGGTGGVNSVVTIGGSGTLTAQAITYCNTLTIKSGTVNAQISFCDEVNIYGGRLNSTAFDGESNYAVYSFANCNFNITAGDVYLYSAYNQFLGNCTLNQTGGNLYYNNVLQGGDAPDPYLYILDTPVTDANKVDITGPGISGSISYNSATRTLSLNNAVISPTAANTEHENAIYVDSAQLGYTPFTISLTGTNQIGSVPADPGTVDDYNVECGICVHGPLLVTGEGSLTVYDSLMGIFQDHGDLTIDIGGSLTVMEYGSSGFACCLKVQSGNLVIERGALDLVSYNSNCLYGESGIIIRGGTITAQSRGPLNAYNTAPVFGSGYTPKVSAGADAASAVLVSNPTSATYTGNRYVKVEPTGGTGGGNPGGGGAPGGGGTPPTTPTTPETGDNKLSTPTGQPPVTDEDGNTTLPGGGTVETPGGAVIDVPAGTTIDKDGNVKIPPGTQADVTLPRGQKITLPGGSTIDSAGIITTGGGSQVSLPDGKTLDIPPGSSISNDGKLTVGSGGATYSYGGMELSIAEGTEIIFDEDVPLGYFISASNPYSDMSDTSWYYDSVMFVYNHGLMGGTSTDPMEFSPNATATRGMIVTILYRMAGCPDVSGLPNPFDDASGDKWYTDAVRWAAANGIVSGYGETSASRERLFGPEDSITREQLAAILDNYIGFAGLVLPELHEYPGFVDDEDITDYARVATEKLFRSGIVAGKPGGVFDPKGNATRAEVAAMLTRLITVS